MSYKIWFQTYPQHLRQLGALFPSSSALGSLMVRHIEPDTHDHILELGSGTGSFTRAPLRRGILEEKLVLLEQSQEFTTLLTYSLPKANVICGDAKDLITIFRSLGIEAFNEIASGLPLNAMEVERRRMICDGGVKMLQRCGSFVQFSYLPRCSIPNTVIVAHSAERIYCGVTLGNIPPAFVWRQKSHDEYFASRSIRKQVCRLKKTNIPSNEPSLIQSYPT